MSVLPCPNCASELSLLEQYRRHYCYSCGRYAPEGYGERGEKICPTCAGVLSYVVPYDRYYCYRCNAYPPEGIVLVSRVEPSIPGPSPPQSASQASVVVVEPVVEPEAAENVKPTTAEVPNQPERQPEEIVADVLRAKGTTPSRARRPLDREEVQVAKKPLLMDLCKQYDLNPTGTKEELRERVLSYIDELEAESRAKEAPEQVEEQGELSASESEVPVEYEDTVPAVEMVEERAVEEEHPMEEPSISTLPIIPPEVVVERPRPRASEYGRTAWIATPPGQEAIVVEPLPAQRVSALHPCPTCGRELSYISQYKRWYCYSCRRYAPRAKSKFACPTCGAALRWIEQYERWWCEAERRYAPSDLPRPERAIATTGTTTAARSFSVATPFATITHRHRSPGGGIGLVGFGVLLFLLYEVLVDLPMALSSSSGVLIAPDVAFGLRFFAFVFVAIGAIMGLSAVRDRR